MTPTFDKIHNRFKFNGLHFTHEEFKEVAYSLVKEGEPYEKITGDFLLDWLNDDDFLMVRTSGATGTPKNIKLQKQAMVNSAIATGNYFGLQPGDSALDCLPSHFIAGKMMLVRAMILGLEIDCVAPVSLPVFDYRKPYDFCAMIPLQLSKALDHKPNIRTIIVGGAEVSKQLKSKIAKCNSRVYETYGMTETVTHVAVKPLKSKADPEVSSTFKALPNVKFSQDDRQCLVIQATKLLKGKLVTNDIVNLISDQEFEWLGRHDNVINSGGIKLFPEQIESKLQDILNDRFIVASEEDGTLGEKIILIIENPSDTEEAIYDKMKASGDLNKHEIPKQIYTTNKFVETINGKIQRSKTIASVMKK
ncbi:MAG: AMP-binding protein [Bacteroidia bacterium]|nr:AMP-binding protein [Bacteroidia bacterium]